MTEHKDDILQAADIPYPPGIISAHGDKCYSYEDAFKEINITFNQGVVSRH